MTEAISFIRNSLEPVYSADEIRNLSRIILTHITGLLPYQLLTCKDRELSMTEKKDLDEIIKRLQQSEPIQYIIGECVFYGLTFHVTPSTLIPRPETEELVDYIISVHSGSTTDILDIGTGSGCIAIALGKHMPQATIDAIDISGEALQIAKKNAEKNQVDIRFLKTDILKKQDYIPVLKNKYDIIVSNPPYVTEQEKEDMEKNVLDYEPHTALFVKNQDPLLFYRKIAEMGEKNLTDTGVLYFEINRQYGDEISQLLAGYDYRDIVLKKDLSGNNRIISARK